MKDTTDQTAPELFAALEATGIEPGTLARAVRLSRETGEPIDRVLTRLGIVSEADMAATHARLTGARPVAREAFPQDRELLDRLGRAFAESARILPLGIDGDVLALAMADPLDRATIRLVEMKMGLRVEPRVAGASDIEAHFERLGTGQGDEAAPQSESTEIDLERLRGLASDAPVIRLVTQMIRQAAELGASDIHLEPFETELRLRYRVDGVLQAADAPPSALRAAIVSRVKIMAGLDIAEQRLPQDGRIRTVVLGRTLDLRVATVPTLNGEGVVIRLLDRSGMTLSFSGLGLDPETEDALTRLIRQPNGIVLVTGPTGSGKTTTLYAALERLNDAERKIVTVEDPVEYRLDGINQIQVQPNIGLGFAEALRSILRQDPDIIMIGEIRDLETARIAVQAALTGHLVLATLHTNSAAAAVDRLRDMGVPGYLIAATLNGVVAQRLVRRLCDCAEPDPEASALAASLGIADLPAGAAFRRPVGCPDCGGKGYRGRIGLMEVLESDAAIRALILGAEGEEAIGTAARDGGMRDLARHGVQRACEGTTSLAEIARVTAVF